MKKSTQTLLGFLAGAAVGVGIYAFLQSEQGKAWLQKMKDTSGDLKDNLSDLAQKAADSWKEWESNNTSKNNG
jgi:hypothetical protein